MRNILYLLILISISACSDNEPIHREAIQRLKEFEYPLDSLRDGKVFIYTNDLGEYFFVEQKKVTENGVDYILKESCEAKKKSSSEKFKMINNEIELIETYIYDYPDSLSDEFTKDKAEILETRNLNDGLKYRGSILKLAQSIGNFRGKMTTKQTFIREDKLQIIGQNLDVLVFTNDIYAKAWHRYVPFFSTQTTYTGENYYARGLGLVKYTTKADAEETDEWTLYEIRNLD